MLTSKFPRLGTTIFTVMSQAASKHGAINLSQGFPDFEMDTDLADLCYQAMTQGHNQYVHLAGLPALRQAIAHKIKICYGLAVDPDTEITVTSGATEAIFDAVAAVVFPGDEVIVIEPCYDSYIPAIELCGAKAVAVPMEPDFSIDWQKVQQAIGPKTKAIITNTPHNPSGMVFSEPDRKALEEIVEQYNLFLISDEVYEHLIYEGLSHQTALQSEILRSRAFVVFSFGKTYHATGWKLGYCVAPPQLTVEFRKIHQYITFSSFSPAQVALSQYLANQDKYLNLSAFYQQKRDFFLSLVKDLPFNFLPCRGSYFVLADYSKFSSQKDTEFALWLTQDVGVAVIPLSPFFSAPKPEISQKWIRFCFAKKEQTLLSASDKLRKLLL
jgi:methionine aminotransferase